MERKVGHGPFTLMSTTPATWRSAAWCQLHGLYAEVFGLHAELDNAVLGHAHELAGYSRDAMTELKRVAWLGTELWDELLAERAVVSGRLVLSDFTSQAIAAFKEARK